MILFSFISASSESRVCPSPDLTILPKANDASKTLAVLRSSMPVFQAHLHHRCDSEKHLITWKTGFVDEDSGILSPFMLSPFTSFNFTLGSYALRSGLIFLQCTITLTVGDEINFLQDYMFIRAVKSKLFARIKAPNYVVHGGSNFSLDGSKSDPEFLKNLVVNWFSWFCIFKSSEETHPRSCFNGSKFKPFSNENIVDFDTRKLDVGQYEFILEVSSAGIKATANHSLTVASYTALSMR